MKQYIQNQLDLFNEQLAQEKYEESLRKKGEIEELRRNTREANEAVRKALKEYKARMKGEELKYKNDLLKHISENDPLDIVTPPPDTYANVPFK